MSLKAIATFPIFIGNLIQKYISEAYPASCVLVAEIGENELDIELLEQAFGEEGCKDMCPDITDLCVIAFDKDTEPSEIKETLLMVASGDSFYEVIAYCTIFKNGQPVKWESVP